MYSVRGLSLLLFLCAAAFGQFTTASLNGVVLDATGAAVPEARVAIRNTETGFETALPTGSTGLFVFPRLPVGNYRMTVEKSGFSTYVQEGIVLTVNQSATQNVTLRVGQVSERVMVSANVEVVTTGTATVGQLVDERRIVELPLNGRRAQSLLYLAAGTIDLDQSRSLGYAGVYPGEQLANVNGTGPGQVNYQLDGVGHNDTYLNLNLPFPNPDSIQEFALQSDNLSAQYGNAAGGVVNVVTKSGTNDIHGTAFDFLRNGKLNARNFFAPRQDSLKRNQFGGSIGGPVKRDRLFFFGTYQGTPVRTAPEGRIAFVPTAAQRRGDFSSVSRQLVDPVTKQPFPGNIIPESRLSPVARYLIERIPLPNGEGQQITYTGGAANSDEHQFMTKLDYNGGKHQVNGRYFFTDYNVPGSFSETNLLTAAGNVMGVRVQNVAVNHTFAARPSLLFNTWFGWNSQTGGQKPNATFGFPEAGMRIAVPDEREVDFSVDGYFSVSTSQRGANDRGDWTLRENVSKMTGRHELHIGGEVVRIRNNMASKWLQSGNFTFADQLSGDNLADFMLGRVSAFTQGAGEFKDMTGTKFSLYAQDNWRVNQRLTLNFGLRWDPATPFLEEKARIACFVPGAKSTRYPNAPAGLVFGGPNPDPGCPERGYDSNLANFGPRLGFAYRLTNDGKTSLRGGAGIYYTPFLSALVYMHVDPPFGPIYDFEDVSFDDPWGSLRIPSPFPAQFGSSIPGPEAEFTLPVSLYYMQRDLRIPQIATWNFTLERQLTGNWIVRAAYVGNKGTYLSGSDDYNPAQEMNPAVYIPGESTRGNTQQRRLYNDFSGVSAIVSGHNSNYHSGQLTVEKRFGGGLSFLASHTWAKAIDDFGWANPWDRRFDYGVSRDDIAHSFKLSSIWEMPRLNFGGAPGRILNGWGITTNVLWRGGFPYSVRSGVDNSFSGVSRNRADFTGTDINDADLGSGREHDEMISRFFDTSLFRQNEAGTFGNSGKNVLRGPRYFNTDLGILKNTRVTERVNVQFRAEFFNVFNNVNFRLPNATLTSASLGRITTAFDPRIIQFGLKLAF
jgi:hypothetical protein